MQETIKTISFRELKWTDVDVFANKHGFKDRSPFVEYCVAKEVHRRRFKDKKIFEIISLLLMVIILLMLLLRI
jgi:hypothetical protein